MAGATNRAMKAAGIPKATQSVIRVNSGGAHTLKSAIAVAAAHGAPVPDKVHAHIAARDGKAATKTAAHAVVAEHAAKRAEARAVYERGNAGSGDRLSAMRGEIRQLVHEKRQADKAVSDTRAVARQAAGARLGIPKKGPKAKANQREHERQLDAAVNASPDVKRAAMAQVAARSALQSALQSRNATATARKQQRGAEAGGQQDLFSGAPAKRAPSPFERRMAMRDARALRGAQALGANLATARRAQGLKAAQDAARAGRVPNVARSLAAASANVMAARRAAAAAPKSAAELIRAAEKKHLSGFSIASSREYARKQLVNAGTAHAKLTEARAAHAKAAAAVDSARGRYDRGNAERTASHTAHAVREATAKYAKHIGNAKEQLREVRKAEASLPPDVRAQVRPQKQAKTSLGSSPEARAKMAAVKARLPELRAARVERMRQKITRGEKVAELRDKEIQWNGANMHHGKVAESMGRAQRYRNAGIKALTRLVGSTRARGTVDYARSTAKGAALRQYMEKYPRPAK